GADPLLRVIGQGQDVDVELDRHPRLDLVDVLSARPATSRCCGAEQARRHDRAGADVEIAHGSETVAKLGGDRRYAGSWIKSGCCRSGMIAARTAVLQGRADVLSEFPQPGHGDGVAVLAARVVHPPNVGTRGKAIDARGP